MEEDGNSMPVFSLEIISDGSNDCTPQFDTSTDTPTNTDTPTLTTENTQESELVRILNNNPEVTTKSNDESTESKETTRSRSDLLEYVMRDDGSVICKLCGEILQKRTHWYRHKYKVHVAQPTNPSPLFQCNECQVFFKSRKGYIGHLASKHSDVLSDSTPVVSDTQTTREMTTQTPPENEYDQDPEMSIPKATVPNSKYHCQVDYRPVTAKTTDTKQLPKPCKSAVTGDEEKSDQSDVTRSKEEKFVFDIINRVKRECEAQGSGNSTRRGYARRQNTMQT